jgi:hypothetical protein
MAVILGFQQGMAIMGPIEISAFKTPLFQSKTNKKTPNESGFMELEKIVTSLKPDQAR